MSLADVGAVGVGIGARWGRLRARRQCEKKEYLERLIVSLSTITDGTLRIRTALEKSRLDVLLNRVAVRKVMDAAQLTTEASPIVPLAKEDAWYLLNWRSRSDQGVIGRGQAPSDTPWRRPFARHGSS